MLLSIITINYNNATGLRKTIESVVEQVSDQFEYIVIDGGSSDGSIDIIKEFGGKIRYWISEPDNGIYHAMNKGIIQAKGKYCQFLNSGDILANTHVIQNMLLNISDAPVVVGNMLKVIPNKKLYHDIGIANNKITMFTFYRGTINHSPAFIKRSLFQQYGLYDENLKIVSDWKWYLQVVGLAGESVQYRNIDVTVFDMTGISTVNKCLERQERHKVLSELIPKSILEDYNAYSSFILQVERINRYRLLKKFTFILDRVLAKIERISSSFKIIS